MSKKVKITVNEVFNHIIVSLVLWVLVYVIATSIDTTYTSSVAGNAGNQFNGDALSYAVSKAVTKFNSNTMLIGVVIYTAFILVYWRKIIIKFFKMLNKQKK